MSSPASARRLKLTLVLLALAASGLYLGFDAASSDGRNWWQALTGWLPNPGAAQNTAPGMQPVEFGSDADSDETKIDVTGLQTLPDLRSSAMPFTWPVSEGAGGEGIHRAVRRKGVWFPVYSPGSDPGETDNEPEKAEVPLYITSGTPPRTAPGEALKHVFEAIGGVPPYRWRMVLEKPGFAIDPASGLFSGSSDDEIETPLAVHVSDAEGSEDSALYTLRIGRKAEPLQITANELPLGMPGGEYHAGFSASGGSPPYLWSVDETLPAGLALDTRTGVISGITTSAIEQEMLVRVSDKELAEAERVFALRFASVIEITTPSRLPPAAPGTPVQLTFEARGGSPPLAWRLISGQLPADASGASWELTPEGALSGLAPQTDSLFRFTLEASDSLGNQAQKTFQLPVRNALLIQPSQGRAGLAWRPREIARDLSLVPSAYTVTRSLSADGGSPRVVYQGTRNNFVDHGLAPGIVYYYTLHAHTGTGAPVAYAAGSSILLPFTTARGTPGRLADPHADAVRWFRPLAEGGHGAPFVPANVLGPPDGRGTYSPASDPAQVLSLHARAGSLNASLDLHGGLIVLAFEDNLVWDGPGEDFTVFENVFFINGDANRRFMEPAIVSVALFEDEWIRFPIDVVPPATTSSTPITMDPFYYNRGFAGRNATTGSEPTDPRQSGGDSFDLASLQRGGLSWIRFVKIQSTGHQVLRDDFGGHPVQHTDQQGALGGNGSSGFDLDAVSAVNY